MARTVRNPIKLPLPHAAPRAEVMDDDGSGHGLERTFMPLNTLWKHKNTNCVNDSSGDDSDDPILTSTGQIAHYRVPILTGAGASHTLSLKPKIRCKKTTLVTATDSFEVRFKVGAVTLTEYFNHDGSKGDADPPEWYEYSGTLDITDDGDTFDLEVEITSIDASVSVSEVIAIDLYPVRDTTALAAGEYDDGFTPQDDGDFEGEEGVHADVLQTGHDDAVTIWERVGVIVTTAWHAGTIEPRTDAHGAFGTPPEGVSKAVFWVRGKENGITNGTVTVETVSDNDTISMGSTSPTFEGPIELDVTPGVPVLFKLTANTSTTLYGWYGWWERATYA